MQMQSDCRGRTGYRVLLLTTATSLLLAGCGVPDSMHVRKGSDPKYEDDDVRFRTTYYFRVFDLCEGRTPMEPPKQRLLFDSAQRGPYYLKTDSLYRFIMTGKASSLTKVHFESGSLRKEQIDPFGTTVNYNKTTNSFLIESQESNRAKAAQAEALQRITELLALRERLEGKVEGGPQAIDALVKQNLDGLSPRGEASPPPSNNSNTATAPQQSGKAADAAGATGQLDATATAAVKTAADLTAALKAAENGLVTALAKFAQDSNATPALLREPGASILAGQTTLKSANAFFTDTTKSVETLEEQRKQQEKDHAEALAKEAAASDADARAALTLDRQNKAKTLEDTKSKQATAGALQARLAPAAAATKAALDLAEKIKIVDNQPLSSSFQIAITAAASDAAQNQNKGGEVLAEKLAAASAANYGLDPDIANAALLKAREASRLLGEKPATAGEQTAKADIDAAIKKLEAAQQDRARYIAQLIRLTEINQSLSAIRGVSSRLAEAKLAEGIDALKMGELKTAGTKVAGDSRAYADAVAKRVAAHNAALGETGESEQSKAAAKAETETAQVFRKDTAALKTAADGSSSAAAKLRDKASPLLKDIGLAVAKPISGDDQLSALLTNVRTNAANMASHIAALESGARSTAETVKNMLEVAGYMSSQPGTTPAGNVRCDNGLAARRGFQILGPEGFRTFDQDERLMMAMTSSAKPLIGMLTDLSNRAINARKGTVDTGRQLAEERRRVGRASDVFYTMTGYGKDTDYSPTDLAKRVSEAFADDGNRKKGN